MCTNTYYIYIYTYIYIYIPGRLRTDHECSAHEIKLGHSPPPLSPTRLNGPPARSRRGRGELARLPRVTHKEQPPLARRTTRNAVTM